MNWTILSLTAVCTITAGSIVHLHGTADFQPPAAPCPQPIQDAQITVDEIVALSEPDLTERLDWSLPAAVIAEADSPAAVVLGGTQVFGPVTESDEAAAIAAARTHLANRLAAAFAVAIDDAPASPERTQRVPDFSRRRASTRANSRQHRAYLAPSRVSRRLHNAFAARSPFEQSRAYQRTLANDRYRAEQDRREQRRRWMRSIGSPQGGRVSRSYSR